MTMVSHGRPLMLATAAIDFDLDIDERIELDGHLRSCPDCRMASRHLRAQASALAVRSRELPSARLHQRVATTWSHPPVRWGGQATRLFLVLAAMLLLAVLVAVGVGARIPDRFVYVPPTATPLTDPLRIGATTKIDVPTGPVPGSCSMIVESGCATDIVVAYGSVWTTMTDGVARVDPVSDRVISTIRVGDDPLRLLAAGGSIWVTVGGSGTLVRVDPGTDRITGSVPIGRLPVGLAWFAGSIWVVDAAARSLVLVDPVEMAVHGGVDLDVEPWALAQTADSIWVTDRYAEHLIEVDPGTKMVRRSLDVPGPIPMNSWDYGAGAIATTNRIWVASGGTVSAFDPVSGSFTTVTTPTFSHLASDGNELWLSSADVQVLERLDPTTLVVKGRQDMPISRPTAAADWESSITAANGEVWLRSYGSPVVRVSVDCTCPRR